MDIQDIVGNITQGIETTIALELDLLKLRGKAKVNLPREILQKLESEKIITAAVIWEGRDNYEQIEFRFTKEGLASHEKYVQTDRYKQLMPEKYKPAAV